MKGPSIAIIGAGLAGLTCGTALKGLVSSVRVFEKNIYPGGRISRFRVGEYEFNHGAQYFTVNNPLFWNIVSAWQTDGIVRSWDGWIVELQNGQVSNTDMATQRFVGQPRMQVIAENLASNCDLITSTTVGELEMQSAGGWRLFNDRGDYLGVFDIVIIATAGNQVAALCRDVPTISRLADKIDMTVCWAGMFAFEQKLDLPFDAANVLDSPLSWISHSQLTDQKPEFDCWLMHATPEWSQQYAASFRGRVMHSLLDAFWEATDLTPVKPVLSSVHCWKHALPINPIGEDSLFDETRAIGACGDWCTAPRIEGAVLSGFSMADRVMKYIHKKQSQKTVDH
ncbi:MAG: NAD(P)-binding protein [Gammaproteobacteria bacterium]|nr:NAD(P)-binding protein [Gammaproteobacteria bacterium]MCZ6797078.1 NAD(P)-binding protein [Gammaproteobacteria bacterium]